MKKMHSDRHADLFFRILDRVDVDKETECWIWQGSHSGHGRGGGYGRMTFEGHQLAVHRAMATLVHGYIHKKQHVDHTCNNRLCVNPAHLEVVSQKENQRRKHARKKDDEEEEM